MNTITKLLLILIINAVTHYTEQQNAYNLTVNVAELNNNDGKVFIALYNTESGFLEKAIKASKHTISNKSCKVTFKDITSGVYAVSIFHDENDNGKLDTNFLGIPNEDYGCSNDATGFMGPPKWKDAKFKLNTDKTITISL